MLDLLLLAEKKGLIDEAGIKEEMDTFTFEVSCANIEPCSATISCSFL